jgi:hypothetical protein
MRIVSGSVIGSDGSRVANASVEIIPVTSGGTAGAVNWIRTNDLGEFRVAVRPGHYQMRAKDEADGYADPNFLLSREIAANFPDVIVDDKDVQDVRVRLGLKGGVVEGEVRDVTSQIPIAGAKVTIRDARSLNAFVEVFTNQAGRFQFTVPPKPIVVSATARGYSTGSFAHGSSLLLSEGEHRDVILALAPK